MVKNIKLSIVFPNWNRAEATSQLIKSVYLSNFKLNEIEIIMVDNGSTDSSVALVKKQYPEVKIIQLDINFGTSYARNRGLEKARGDFIFCCDNDIVVIPETLEILIKELNADSSIGLTGAKVLSIENKKSLIACGYEFNRWLGLEDGLHNCGQKKQVDWVPGCCMMFRRNILTEIGYFDENFRFFGEDADFGLRVKKAGYKVINLNKAIVYHPKSQNKKWNKDMYLNYYEAKFRLIQKYCIFLQKLVAFTLHMTLFSLIRYITNKPENWFVKFNALLKTL